VNHISQADISNMSAPPLLEEGLKTFIKYARFLYCSGKI
jgi:hypothetical protein